VIKEALAHELAAKRSHAAASASTRELKGAFERRRRISAHVMNMPTRDPRKLTRFATLA
jgi:hypothetical protein